MPSMQQTLVDRRFRDNAKSIGAIVYSWTNAFAAGTNDPALQKIVVGLGKQTLSKRPASRWRVRRVVLVVLFITVLIPPALMLLQKASKKRILKIDRIL